MSDPILKPMADLDLYEINEHAQTFMARHGITYQFAIPQSLYDSWQFWNPQNLPDPLPKGLTVIMQDPLKHIGYGLSAEKAAAIIAYQSADGGSP